MPSGITVFISTQLFSFKAQLARASARLLVCSCGSFCSSACCALLGAAGDMQIAMMAQVFGDPATAGYTMGEMDDKVRDSWRSFAAF